MSRPSGFEGKKPGNGFNLTPPRALRSLNGAQGLREVLFNRSAHIF
jgi:hypothetical protein